VCALKIHTAQNKICPNYSRKNCHNLNYVPAIITTCNYQYQLQIQILNINFVKNVSKSNNPQCNKDWSWDNWWKLQICPYWLKVYLWCFKFTLIYLDVHVLLAVLRMLGCSLVFVPLFLSLHTLGAPFNLRPWKFWHFNLMQLGFLLVMKFRYWK
jgi:hypothetical protein